MEEERRVWDGLRKKLLKDASEEKDRLVTLMTRERTEFEEKINQLNAALSEANQTSLHEVARIKKELETEYGVGIHFLFKQNSEWIKNSVVRVNVISKQIVCL